MGPGVVREWRHGSQDPPPPETVDDEKSKSENQSVIEIFSYLISMHVIKRKNNKFCQE